MGLHIGIVAAKVPVAKLREAFLSLHPKYELVESSEVLSDDAELSRWMDAHERRVSAADWSPGNKGSSVFGLWRDGEWAVLMDNSYVFPSDRGALERLSNEVGGVLAMIVETTGGTAFFEWLEYGAMVRRVEYCDGQLTTEGEPLPQEAWYDGDVFYMDEAEKLTRAFGMASLGDLTGAREVQAFTVVDHTDYSGMDSSFGAVVAKAAPAAGEVRARVGRKPWWKFW